MCPCARGAGMAGPTGLISTASDSSQYGLQSCAAMLTLGRLSAWTFSLRRFSVRSSLGAAMLAGRMRRARSQHNPSFGLRWFVDASQLCASCHAPTGILDGSTVLIRRRFSALRLLPNAAAHFSLQLPFGRFPWSSGKGRRGVHHDVGLASYQNRNSQNP